MSPTSCQTAPPRVWRNRILDTPKRGVKIYLQRTIKNLPARPLPAPRTLLSHQPRDQTAALLGGPPTAAEVPHEQGRRSDGHADTDADDDVTDQSLHVLPDEMARDASPAMASKKANPRGLAQMLDLNGAGERNRTLDLRITSAVLKQNSGTHGTNKALEPKTYKNRQAC